MRLFLAWFNNFDQTMGFYWSYTLLLESPVLMHSCIILCLVIHTLPAKE